MRESDTVTLRGKSRKGKNRVHENGPEWRVERVLPGRVLVRPVRVGREAQWRWVDLPVDVDMEILCGM